MAFPSFSPKSPNDHRGTTHRGTPQGSTPQRARPRTLRTLDRRAVALDGRFEAARQLALTPLDEIRALDAAAFTELPLPTVLELEVPGCAGPVWLRSAPGRGAAVDAPVIDGPTFRAIAIAVASDRARPLDFQQLVDALGRDPHADGASLVSSWMDAVVPSSRSLRMGQVLERLGAKLFSVRIEERDAIVEPAANGPVLAYAG
jgi:hypothetical protein